jgi:hypothetical protein
MTTDLQRELTTRGIAQLPAVFDASAIAILNEQLDPLFSEASSEGRSYVGADELAERGLLAHVFAPGIRSVIEALFDDDQALVYHCHVYEIAAAQSRPHIGERTLNGWHRDAETIELSSRDEVHYVSLFTYLNDVEPDGGAFELLPRPPIRAPAKGDPCVAVSGSAGFTFVWNRTYFHRASPNRSLVRRRVLKLSLQSIRLPHDRLDDPELTGARELVSGDPWLRALFGGPPCPEALHTPRGHLDVVPFTPNGWVAVTPAHVAAHHVRELRRTAAHRVKRLLRA